MGQPASYRFILLPSLVGLICYACSQPSKTSPKNIENTWTVTSTESTIDPSAIELTAVTEVPPSSKKPSSEEKPNQTAVSSELAYQNGINLASGAYQLSQSAISPDDWGLVASRWERAIKQLQQVHDNSSHYTVAQTKVEDYTRHAKHATDQITTLQDSAKIAIADNKPSATARSAVQPSNAPSGSPPRLSAPKTASPNKKIVPVVRRLHGTPIVRVTFNGVKTYDMILDTGASRTLITRAMANDLNVVATERMIAATASESEVVFELGRVESISMGDITLSGAQVSIGDSVSIGLLGNDFLNGYDITIRGRENVVELVRN